jgi:dolichyl-diphosphooligosaccharide--protein glycosyltransferase
MMNLSIILAVFLFIGVFLFLTMSGTTRISGRVMTLIDPNYAGENMPLVASVSEHAPPSWDSYFKDINFILFFSPVGLYYCLVHKVTHGKFFIAIFALCTAYFSCHMIRLILLVAPAACLLAGIGASHLIGKAMKSIRLTFIGLKQEGEGGGKSKSRLPFEVSVVLLGLIFMILKHYVLHSNYGA